MDLSEIFFTEQKNMSLPGADIKRQLYFECQIEEKAYCRKL